MFLPFINLNTALVPSAGQHAWLHLSLLTCHSRNWSLSTFLRPMAVFLRWKILIRRRPKFRRSRCFSTSSQVGRRYFKSSYCQTIFCFVWWAFNGFRDSAAALQRDWLSQSEGCDHSVEVKWKLNIFRGKEAQPRLKTKSNFQIPS